MKKISLPGILKLCAVLCLLSLVQCNKIEDPFYNNEGDDAYQQKPVITRIVIQQRDGVSYYLISVNNLATEDSANKVSLNGKAMTVEAVFRSGSAEYNQEPKGEKLLILEKELLPSVYQADFIVTSNGIKSDAYHYVFEPYINFVSAFGNTGERERNVVAPGDTAYIYGHFFGEMNDHAKIELWNTPSTQGKNSPDPEILSWENTEIQFVVPSYDVSHYDFDMELHIRNNGKDAIGKVRYIQLCAGLNEVYTGEYQYPQGVKQPYAFEFFGEDSMYFTSSYDRYSGTYTYDCGTEEVTMDFAGHGVIVKAIHENNALTHFTFIKSSGFDFVSANLNTTWDQNLDGTKWQEDIIVRTPLKLEFAAGNKVGVQGRGVWYDYVRRNGTITFSLDGTEFFGYIENRSMELESNGVVIVLKKE